MNKESLRVLLVEDEALIALNLEQLMEELGWEVTGVAASSAQAMALAEQTPPDLAVVDVNLVDGRTGLAVAERLAVRFGVMVVIATANPEDVKVGGHVIAVVRKPYSDAALMAQMREAARAVTHARSRPVALARAPLERANGGS
ncbi:MAG TPA: response regulator [Mesorhizobium sp.]|jgi:CheY-like chemotaxis protein|nr:response regulator [Mesorhizobium sp.]